MVSEQVVQEFIGSLWVNTATTLLIQVFVMPVVVWVMDCMKAAFAKPVKQLEWDSSLEQWPVQIQDIHSASYDDELVEAEDVLARQSNNSGVKMAERPQTLIILLAPAGSNVTVSISSGEEKPPTTTETQ